MMADIQNPQQELSARVQPFVVVMSDNEDVPPRPDLPLENPPTTGAGGAPMQGWQCVKVVQSAGGAALDFAELQAALTEPQTDTVQPAAFTRMVEICFPDSTASPALLGDYVSETHELSAKGETLTGTVQLRGYHFGNIAKFVYMYNRLAPDGWDRPHWPIQFNPVVDGKRLANRSSLMANNAPAWIHPEAATTNRAITYQGQTPRFWTLKEAVQALCEMLNPDEEFIANPSESELDEVLGHVDDVTLIDNVTLELGHTLDWYLDRLLQPVGFNWYVAYALPSEWTQRRKIRIFERGVGEIKTLKLQPEGEAYNPAATNVAAFKVTRNIGDSVNAVHARGSFEVCEFTLPLHRAWPEADDQLELADLDSTVSGSLYNIAGKTNTWRNFNANLDGNLTGLRTSVDPAGDPPNLQPYFVGPYLPYKRKMGDCLTFWEDGEGKSRRGPLVEWSPENGDPGTWTQVPQSWGDVVMLRDDCGVIFNVAGPPPKELRDAGNKARVRMTGTIQGDGRIEDERERKPAESVNGRDVWLYKELNGKWNWQDVQTSGPYLSTLSGGPGDVVDDSGDIVAYSLEIQNQYQSAIMDCSIRLAGWVTDYQIGDLLSEIEGRGISLNMAAEGTNARYAQVIERTFGHDGADAFTILKVARNAT